MRSGRILALLLGSTLALLLWVASMPATTAGAQEPERETVTTLLHPGWNMVGWVDRTTHVRQIFEAIPELTEIRGWDTRDQRYRRSTPTSTGYRMSRVSHGQGVWLHIESDAVVEWVRPVWDRYALLALEAGLNLTGWTGRDAEPVDAAFARFGDSLRVAWRWDAEAQRFQVYVPGAGDLNTLETLNRGDGLLVDLSGEVSWWQSGFGRTTVTFTEEVTPERREDVHAGLAEVIAFFAETYDIQPPDFDLRSGEGLPNQARTVFLGRPPGSRVQSSTVSIGSEVTGLSLNRTLAHEYFHVLQHSFAKYPYPPRWMTEGAATYAAALYEVAVGVQAGETIRQGWHHSADYLDRPITELEDEIYGIPGGYEMGALAVDWLVQHAAREPDGDTAPASRAPTSLPEQVRLESFIEYYRLLSSLLDWQAAFEQAFGISTEAFYATFEPAREEAGFESALRVLFDIGLEEFTDDREAYREAATRPLPHTIDDVTQPVAVFLGDVAPALQESLRTRLKDISTFLISQLGAEPYEYSVYVAADDESARPTLYGLYRQRYFSGTTYCSFRTPQFVFHRVSCSGELSDRTLVRMAFIMLRPPTASAGQPWWIREAGHYYATIAFKAWMGEEPYEDELVRLTGEAHTTSTPLQEIETQEGWQTAGNSESLALSLLAVDWLVKHAGERSLLEYYRLLPRSDAGHDGYEPRAGSWEAAFEQAFGLTPDDFYGRFETYRAELLKP